MDVELWISYVKEFQIELPEKNPEGMAKYLQVRFRDV